MTSRTLLTELAAHNETGYLAHAGANFPSAQPEVLTRAAASLDRVMHQRLELGGWEAVAAWDALGTTGGSRPHL